MKFLLGLLMILVCVFGWILSAEVFQQVQEPTSPNYFYKPYFIAWFTGFGYSLFFLVYLFERWRTQTSKPELSLEYFFGDNRNMLKFSCVIFVFYFTGHYTWLISLPITSVSANTTIYNCSFVFILILSFFVLKERVSYAKMMSLVLCLIGILLVTIGSLKKEEFTGVDQKLYGYLFLIISVIIYSFYVTVYKFFSKKDSPSTPDHGVGDHEYQFTLLQLDDLQNNNNNTISNNNDDSSIGDNNDMFRDLLIYADKPQNIEKIHSNDMINNNDQSLSPPLDVTINHISTNTTMNSILTTTDNDDDNNNELNGEVMNSTTSTKPYMGSLLCTGLIGLLGVIVMWPGLIVLDVLKIEDLELPSWKVILILLTAQGLAALQNVAFLLGVHFTSPLFMSVGLLLTIPASIACDLIFHSYLMPIIGLVGVSLVCGGFLLFYHSDYVITHYEHHYSSQYLNIFAFHFCFQPHNLLSCLNRFSSKSKINSSNCDDDDDDMQMFIIDD